jgi:DNA-binding SARP family transcriptional activator
VHNVRRMMGATSIALNDDVVRLCPAGGLTLDVDVFEQAAARARSSSDVATLQHALQLWTGPLLPEDQYAEWALEHAERLTETHAALATLLGRSWPSRATMKTPSPCWNHSASPALDEHLHRVLIEVLAGLGRRWEAIEAYERLRAALDEAYAAEPELKTKTLYRRLLTGGRPMPTTAPHNLPASSTSFIGRRRLLSELSASNPRERAHGYQQRALLTFMAGEWVLAQAQIDEAVRIAEEFPSVTASAQHFAGVLALARGEIEVARTRFDASLQALQRVAGPSTSVTIHRCRLARRPCCSVVASGLSKRLDM